MIQGFINGIKNMVGSVGKAVSGIGEKVKSFLHFSRPDEGPLREYEKWMPDMVKGLSKSLKTSSPQLYNESKALAEKVARGFDLASAYNKMKTAVNLETQKLSTNLTANAVLKVGRDTAKTTNNDNRNIINNTQNFYEKNPTPYEQQKQAKQELRRLAYGL